MFFLQVLKDVALQPGGTYFTDHKNFNKEDISYRDLLGGIRGFYFSANWVCYSEKNTNRKFIITYLQCPPCRAFTPQLIEAYRIIRQREPNFEILFVSSDR